MALSEAKKKANNKYIKSTFDSVTLRLPKGQKETTQAHAQNNDESLNSFINRAISETIERDKINLLHKNSMPKNVLDD